MAPIGSADFDFPCTRTVVTPGAAPDVGLDEEDFCVENDKRVDDREDWGVVDVVVVTVPDEGRIGSEELDEVVIDDEGRVASLTMK